MKHMKAWQKMLLVTLSALVLLLGSWTGLVPSAAHSDSPAITIAQAEDTSAALLARSKKKATPTPRATATPTAAPSDVMTPTPLPDGPIIDPQSIADYIFANGCLPDNFITKREAQDLGWDSAYNYVSDAAPGMSIGGDRFGNYEGLLPAQKGRTYYECDCYYTTGRRNAYRVIFSNDGLVYYTADHYQTFTQLFPSCEDNDIVPEHSVQHLH